MAAAVSPDAPTNTAWPSGALPECRWRAALELAVVIGLLALDLWYVRVLESPVYRAAVYLGIVATVLLSWRRRQSSTRATLAAASSWGLSLAVTLGLVGALVVGGYLVREPYEQCWLGMLRRRPGELAAWASLKVAVVLCQQIGLQWFLWPLCRELLRGRLAALTLAAAIFGLLHLPSTTLVLMTALAALVWIWLWERTGRLLPILGSHLVLAVLAHGLLPERLIYDMRVGGQAVALRERRHLAYQHQTRVQLRHFAAPAYYRQQGNTDEGPVNGLYRDVLGRTAEPWEVEMWVANLRRTSQAEVAEEVLISHDSQERQALARQESLGASKTVP